MVKAYDNERHQVSISLTHSDAVVTMKAFDRVFHNRGKVVMTIGLQQSETKLVTS